MIFLNVRFKFTIKFIVICIQLKNQKTKYGFMFKIFTKSRKKITRFILALLLELKRYVLKLI